MRSAVAGELRQAIRVGAEAVQVPPIYAFASANVMLDSPAKLANLLQAET